MTPIGGIADAGSIPAISTKSMGMSRFRRGEQRKDDDPAQKAYVTGNEKLVDDLFIDIDALELAIA